MTVYDSLSGKEIQSLPAPETMDGVYYDAKLKRVYMIPEQASGEKVGDDRPICGDARKGMVAARNGRADATTTRLMALGPGRFHVLPLLRILTKP
jgi:hypothetical protein